MTTTLNRKPGRIINVGEILRFFWIIGKRPASVALRRASVKVMDLW